MSTSALVRRFTNAPTRIRVRIIAITACLLIVATATIAHAFLSFNSSTVRLSYNADRSFATSLSGKTVRGDIYVFSRRTSVKSISYYINPVGSLSRANLFATRTVAPYDLGGTDSEGNALPVSSARLKSGQNLLVSQHTLKDGSVSYDFTWFNVNKGAVTTSPTTTKPTTTSSTSSSTTTTTAAGHGDHGSAGQENCTIGQLGNHGPCVNRDLIPAPRQGYSTDRLTSASIPVRGFGEPGAFRTRCDFSHMNYDDPVLFLNQPGRAHLHTFFGNTRANAFSTSESLLTSGNSTCSGGTINRSSYWVPAMIESRTGRPIVPNDDRGQYNSDLEIYYKLGYQGVGYQDVRAFPNGLQIIAGNSATATGPTENSRVDYWCEGPVSTDRTRRLEGASIPRCNVGEVLTMHIDFPQCWDGRTLRSENGRSHMAYGTWHNNPTTTVGCPSTHPVGLPSIAMFVRYRVKAGDDTSTWRLASDKYTSGPGGYSGHADYVFAWPKDSFEKIINNCYRTLSDCGYGFGDGTGPIEPRF